MIENINTVEIPLGLLHQYMPIQYVKVRDGNLVKGAKALLMDCVVEVVETYNFATKYRYMISEAFVS